MRRRFFLCDGQTGMLSPVERTALVIVTLGLLGFIVYVVSQKSRCDAKLERFQDAAAVGPTAASASAAAAPGGLSAGPALVGSVGKPLDAETTVPSCYPRDRLTADDLLPKDAANSKWAQMNPAGQGDVQGVNFLSSSWQAGVDTIGSSLKNASHDLRSEFPNPQLTVSPWMNTSITPNLLRKPLEIGA